MTSKSSLFCSKRSVAQKSNALFFARQNRRPTDRFSWRRKSFPSNQSAAEARSFMVGLLRLAELPPGSRLQHLFCMNEQNRFSRRRIIGGLGMGLIAATAPRVLATEQSVQQAPPPSDRLQDLTSKYPKPPFKGQSQPWPGLASKMDPPPDHGEKSYRGSGRLKGLESADYWRRFRGGTGSCYRICTGGRGRSD